MILDPRKANSTGNESDVFTTVNMPFSIVRANIGNSWWQNLAFTVMARFRQDFHFFIPHIPFCTNFENASHPKKI